MKVRQALSIPALLLGSILGQFGNDVRPQSFDAGGQVQGYRGGKRSRKTTGQQASDRRSRHRCGHGKGHRRTYLTGKSWCRV